MQAIIHKILELAAARYGVEPDDIVGPHRFGPAVQARRLAAWLLVRGLGFSLSQAGQVLGGREHSTIIHALRMIEADAKKDGELKALMDEFLAVIKKDQARSPKPILSATLMSEIARAIAVSIETHLAKRIKEDPIGTLRALADILER